jgi:hypothetical protein
MASRDLDAALQLLADRAQYITGASGAAIALRRGGHNDMLCRASSGAAAPELGALLPTERGLAGECVRTGQALGCDDVESDPRVDREACRRLGVASVVVMPILSQGQVLGVFELLSGKARAFEERDLAALQRLSEMVETAIRHAASETDSVLEAFAGKQPLIPAEATPAKPAEVVSAATATTPVPDPAKASPSKPLFWSAPQTGENRSLRTIPSVESPAVRHNLQKCQACGFPVTPGRTFCVQCEEKKWQGHPLPPAPADAVKPARAVSQAQPAASPILESDAAVPASHAATPFLSSALPSESWFAANKFLLGALLVVAAIIGAFAWLR